MSVLNTGVTNTKPQIAMPPSAAVPASTPAIKTAPELREFGDNVSTRDRIYNDILRVTKELPPLQNQKHTLRISNVDYTGPDRYSLKEQKEAILTGKTLGRKLYGTWELLDNATGQVIDSKKTLLARVPFLTERGTFVHNGNEYTLSNQMRLRPGIFTRVKDNGEIEAHANIIPGKGVSHRYFLDPAKGIFYVKFGQAKIPLMPLLRALNIPDKTLQETWGRDLWAANVQKDNPAALNKILHKLARKADLNAPTEHKYELIRSAIEKMEIDPEVSESTLGKNFNNINAESILATTKKLLDVSLGKQEVDDRDHLAYQTVLGPEDLLLERIAKDSGGIRRALFYKASFKNNLSSFQPGILTKQLEAALLHSGLGQNLEEINPAEVLDKQTKISRLGEGGIPSIEAVPDEARAVQPSHFGYIDPVRTPECYDELTEVLTRDGWKYWSQVTDNDLFACLLDSRIKFHRATKVIKQKYDGELFGLDSNYVAYRVTPNHRMYVADKHLVARSHDDNFKFDIKEAKDVYLKDFLVRLSRFKYAGKNIDTYSVKGKDLEKDLVLDIVAFSKLFGYVMIYGEIVGDNAHVPATICLKLNVNKEPELYEDIVATLRKLDLQWQYFDGLFHIPSYTLSAYFNANYFETVNVLKIFINFPVAARRTLINTLLLQRGFNQATNTLLKKQFSSVNTDLLDQLSALATLAGISSRIKEADGCHVISFVEKDTFRSYYGKHSKTDFSGTVYCAEVPGGLLFVRRGKDTCGFWCGNSFRVGVDAYIANRSKKGSDGRIYTPFYDKKGEIVYKSPQDIHKLVVAFPKELEKDSTHVVAMKDGKLSYVPRDAVDLIVPNFENAFSPLGNMVPIKSAVKAQRMAMASRMLTQALPLVNAEAPYVRTGIAGKNSSYEHEYGRHMGAVYADKPGTVLSVDNDSIKVKYSDGTVEEKQLYNSHPFNRKTFLHNTPLVRQGQTINSGQLLAKSNYTNNDGTTALGTNLRVAYVPYKGYNFEDALVISESAAKKLTSEHMYQHVVDWTDEHKKGKKDYISLFGNKYDKNTLNKLDDDGVIKPGQTVKFGDPLILAAKKKARTYGKIHKKREEMFGDASETWDHHSDGIVTDVVKTNKGITVLVKSTSAMEIADKLSGRYGDKGVISAIVPDDKMPQDKDGKPFEVLLNPLGIISRTNPSQIIETALGKIAEKYGKHYDLVDFDNVNDWTEYAIKELEKHKMSDLEDIIDPETGTKIPQVLTGNRFFMKLHHVAESKAQGRGTGGYAMDATPAKGGEHGSKMLGLLDSNALLSSGATEVLRDAGAIRGQRNEEYWLPFMQGLPPPKPKVPFVYEKFVNELKASGINVIRDGYNLNVMALTDKDIERLAGNRYITSGDTVHFEKNMRPVKGGLFDETLTGGNMGNRWAAIKLDEPMPNPVMEEPIRRLLGLTQNSFEEILIGKKTLNGKSGPGAIADALKNINIDKELAITREAVNSGKTTARDAAIRKLSYLKAAKRLNLHPKDWILSAVPVLPPMFRPVSVMSNNGMPLVSDANYLYKELILANDNLREMRKQVDDVSEERASVYKAFKAVTGLGEPSHPKLQEKQVKGLLKHIFGSSPKFGTVQRRLLSNTVDLVGRAVITPNPDLDMDTIGLPENRAWDIYKNFVIRRLKRRGMPLLEAVKQVDGRTKLARTEMLNEMSTRPVIVNRAPVLHKFGIMAFYPKLVSGNNLEISPLIVKGFGADFDGDAMQYHVPVSDEAKDEAIDRLLPSKNLLSPADFNSPAHGPGQEYIGGLYHATANKSNRQKQVFRDIKSMIAAYKRGEIDITDPVEILT